MIWPAQPSARLGFDLPPAPAVHEVRAEPGPYLCQLAQDYGPRNFPSHGAVVYVKVDGIRCLWFRHGPPETREGKPIDCAWWTGGPLSILAERLGPGDWFIDGELTVGPDFDSTLRAFKRKLQDGRAIVHVFDAIPMREWESGDPGLPLHERKRRLREAFDLGPIEGLGLVESHEAPLPEGATLLAERVWARGGEGVVIKDRLAPYQRSRGRSWQKLKRLSTFTVRITGWRELRQGKPPADGLPRLGALLGTFNGVKVSISQGQGWTDEMRRWMAGHADTFEGRLCDVAAMERTASGSLRHARFLRWRDVGEG